MAFISAKSPLPVALFPSHFHFFLSDCAGRAVNSREKSFLSPQYHSHIITVIISKGVHPASHYSHRSGALPLKEGKVLRGETCSAHSLSHFGTLLAPLSDVTGQQGLFLLLLVQLCIILAHYRNIIIIVYCYNYFSYYYL